jgi:hypothetical protein
MILEPKVQLGWEYLNDMDFFSIEAGAELKFPLKFMKNVVIAPYGAVSFPVPLFSTDSIFDHFPLLGFGGGIQLGIKGGKSGTVFVDVNYMYYGDVGIYNHYGDLYPNPPVIHYQRSVIGLGIGYKIGFIDRKLKAKDDTKSEESKK